MRTGLRVAALGVWVLVLGLWFFGAEGSRLSGDVLPSERERVFMYTIRRPIGANSAWGLPREW